MARLYANENFPQPAVDALHELGHDVLTTLDSGKAGQAISYEDVLAFATAENTSSGFTASSQIMPGLSSARSMSISKHSPTTSTTHLRHNQTRRGSFFA
jgi:hypothetical protein